jgi:hypothetical protein
MRLKRFETRTHSTSRRSNDRCQRRTRGPRADGGGGGGGGGGQSDGRLNKLSAMAWRTQMDFWRTRLTITRSQDSRERGRDDRGSFSESLSKLSGVQ